MSRMILIGLLFFLSACFHTQTTLDFTTKDTVQTKTALILSQQLVDLSEAAGESEAFCIEAGAVRKQTDKGVSCEETTSTSLDAYLLNPQIIQFGSYIEEAEIEGEGFGYEAVQRSDGSIFISIDLSELKELAGEQVGESDGMTEEERKQMIAFSKAILGDSSITMQVRAPHIISTTGTLADDNTAQVSFKITDIFDGIDVPDSFDIHFQVR